MSPESSVGRQIFGEFGRRKAKKAPPQAGLFLDFLASEAFETLEKTCFRRPEYVRNRAVAVRHRQKKIRLRRAFGKLFVPIDGGILLSFDYCPLTNSFLDLKLQYQAMEMHNTLNDFAF